MEDITEKDIELLTEAITESTGVDFSNYAFSSYKRRISRFMEFQKIRDLDAFISRIKNDRDFSEYLVEEITVNVTEMFRDPGFWSILRDTVIPRFSSKTDIKIWHAACSTGEEVLSMAILLHQSGLTNRAKITATDINKKAIQAAGQGIYSLRSQEVNSRNYSHFGGKGKLSDYYTVSDNKVCFDKSLLKNIDFRIHDLSKDEPFNSFDLIICRNVLIYFNSDLQEKVIHRFFRSLNSGAFLGIGSKESLMWSRNLKGFEEISIEEKIYRKAAPAINDFKTTVISN